MNDIKVLLKIFKRYKAKIIVLWIVDLFSVIAQTFLPIIIGLTIDNLLNKQSIFTSILPLIMLESFIMILQFTSEKYDDKTYDKILENEKGLYFKYALKREYDNTVISERIDEVDNVVDLFHTQLPNLAGNIAWMVGSVIYLITCTPPFVVVMSSISAIVVSTLSKKKIIDKYASLKEIRELEQEKLLTKKYISLLLHIIK